MLLAIMWVLLLAGNWKMLKGITWHTGHTKFNKNLSISLKLLVWGDTVVKVLCYKSEGRWFDPSWFQWIFH
jgi:hypothetical protein